MSRYSAKVASERYLTFRDLVWNLVYKKDFNEPQRARAIYRWITMNGHHVYSFDGSQPDSPDAVMQDFRYGLIPHAQALKCLAIRPIASGKGKGRALK